MTEAEKLFAMMDEIMQQGQRDKVFGLAEELFNVFERNDTSPAMAMAVLAYALGSVMGGEEVEIEEILPLMLSAHACGKTMVPELREFRRKMKP